MSSPSVCPFRTGVPVRGLHGCQPLRYCSSCPESELHVTALREWVGTASSAQPATSPRPGTSPAPTPRRRRGPAPSPLRWPASATRGGRRGLRGAHGRRWPFCGPDDGRPKRVPLPQLAHMGSPAESGSSLSQFGGAARGIAAHRGWREGVDPGGCASTARAVTSAVTDQGNSGVPVGCTQPAAQHHGLYGGPVHIHGAGRGHSQAPRRRRWTGTAAHQRGGGIKDGPWVWSPCWRRP